jgi:hypothetical protein
MPFYVSALFVDWGLFFYCYVGVRWNYRSAVSRGSTTASFVGRNGSAEEM